MLRGADSEIAQSISIEIQPTRTLPEEVQNHIGEWMHRIFAGMDVGIEWAGGDWSILVHVNGELVSHVNIVDRVVLCLAQLVQATFGAQTVVYRVDAQTTAAVLMGQPAKTVAQTLRQAQARMAPEYEYDVQGSTRRAIDLRQGDEIDAEAFKELVRSAVEANLR